MFQLYIVSCTGGFYAALNSTPPTDARHDLEALELLVHRLRPGHGRHYSTVIARCDEDGNVNEADIELMRREANVLAGFYV